MNCHLIMLQSRGFRNVLAIISQVAVIGRLILKSLPILMKKP
jgi:hypothetical protein